MREFSMSKNAFKRAVGRLLKEVRFVLRIRPLSAYKRMEWIGKAHTLV